AQGLRGRRPRRSELPRSDHSGRVQDRHHAGPYPPAGQGRHRVALRHADLRSREADHRRRPRPVDLHRHRRRPDQRHQLHRRAALVSGRSADRRHHHGRRDRRQRRGRSRRVHRRTCHQAGGRLHRRRQRTSGQAHGPRRRDRVGRTGHGRRQVRRDGKGRDHDGEVAGRPGRGDREAAREVNSRGTQDKGRRVRPFLFTGAGMTAPLRIALAQFDFPVGAVASNADRIIAMIAQARDAHGAGLVLFPELALCGYPPEDLLLRPSFLVDCEHALRRIAESTRGIVAVVGWPQSAGAIVYNAASVLRDGGVACTYRKRELPNYAVFDERRYFDVDPDGEACVFDVDGVSVGLIICEDLWFPEPLLQTAAAGARIVLVPNASPFERDKHAQRDALLAQRVNDTLVQSRLVDGRGVGLAYLNVVGGQDALVFDGASVLADGDGVVHPAAAAFVDQWLVADFNGDTRKFSPVQWAGDGDESRDALAWRAIVRGTRDYCRKNGF